MNARVGGLMYSVVQLSAAAFLGMVLGGVVGVFALVLGWRFVVYCAGAGIVIAGVFLAIEVLDAAP